MLWISYLIPLGQAAVMQFLHGRLPGGSAVSACVKLLRRFVWRDGIIKKVGKMSKLRLLEAVDRCVRPMMRKFRPSTSVTIAGLKIAYRHELDGGGADFGQEFITFFKSRGLPKQRRIFEWCAGPGFIGFSMLGNGLCETLCLADINPAAVTACQATIRTNHLADRATVYLSDNLKSIPAHEKWSLVVSNPPHFVDAYIGDIRAHDPDWRVHREFLTTVSSHLTKDAVIVLQENNRGSTVETFRPMIEASGFEIVSTANDRPQLTEESSFYFICLTRRGSDAPSWAK